ncbi:glutamate-5-semialdehyde dehydrogenase [Candidatus Sumerlaeota bacterium]|nr:glutamate-5-semialdehyde dehydrogenase [Candidatus Sumerlaeota bacterium]
MTRTGTSSTDLSSLMLGMAQRARAAASELVRLTPAQKNDALERMARAIEAGSSQIQAENERDLAAGRAQGLSPAMLDRLALTDRRIAGMIQSLREVVALPDPVGETFDIQTRPNGLRVGRMRSPIGVIGIIYESRPNVTADASCLCLKSGNAVILRGGSEAFHSNTAIVEAIRGALRGSDVPEDAIQLIPVTDREAITAMLHLEGQIDLVIPRGGRGLIETVVREARMQVIKHYDGNCHVYIDAHADLDLARGLVINAKTQRPGVCNAAESLIVHAAVPDPFLASLLGDLIDLGVEIRGDEHVCALEPRAKAATEEDWGEEYLDLILSVKVVDTFEEAVAWINRHGSHHTDAIVTREHGLAMRFLAEVDSACVFVNASTRFSDGGEFGLGCEIGISTDKLHARGPMGLRDLTTVKWIGLGTGQLRS